MPVNTRRLGLVTMAVGAVFSLVGLFGLVSGGSDEPPAAGEPTSTTASLSTSSTPVATTTTVPTSTEVPTTTGASTISSTLPDPVDVEVFVDQFIAWIEGSDVDALVERLHSVVIEEYGEDLCRSFVEREILALEDYRPTGSVSGPDASQFGSVAIDVYRMPVAFTFQGEDFTSDAAFAFEEGVVHWFATCR